MVRRETEGERKKMRVGGGRRECSKRNGKKGEGQSDLPAYSKQQLACACRFSG